MQRRINMQSVLRRVRLHDAPWRCATAALLFVLALIPGTRLAWFNGLPLTPPEAIVIATALLSVFFLPVSEPPRIKKTWCIILFALIVVQTASYFLLPAGWSICVRRELEPETLLKPCEPSAEYRGGQRSFVYPQLDFAGDTTPVFFMNDLAFNYKRENAARRYSIPYSLSAAAFLFPWRDAELSIKTNIPHTRLTVNGLAQEIPFAETVHVPLTKGHTYAVHVSYTAPHSAVNTLSVATSAQPYYAAPITRGMRWPIARWVYQLCFWILCVAFLGLVARRYYVAVRSLSPAGHRALGLIAGTLIVFAVGPPRFAAFFVFAALAIVAGEVLTTTPRNRALLRPAVAGALLVLAMIMASHAQPYGTVTLLPGGSDPLTFESHARAVLTADNTVEFLKAGERGIYYHQPLQRYLLGGAHMLLGDSLWGVYVVQLFLLLLALWATASFAATFGRPVGFSLYAVLGYGALVIPRYTPVKLALSLYQEALAAPLFSLALMGTVWCAYIPGVALVRHAPLAFLWGLIFMIRPDLAPAGAAVLLFATAMLFRFNSLRSRVFYALTLGAAFSLAPLFVVTRNAFIAGHFRVLSSSLFTNLLPQFRAHFADVPAARQLNLPELFLQLWQIYAPHRNDFWALLYDNVVTNFIGADMLLRVEWSLFATSSLVLLLWPRARRLTGLASALIVVAVLPPVLFGAFFLQDNPLGLHAHLRLILTVACSVLLVFLYRGWNRSRQGAASTPL